MLPALLLDPQPHHKVRACACECACACVHASVEASMRFPRLHESICARTSMKARASCRRAGAPVGGVPKVLDLCCAPGSKTSQLLDMMHRAAGRAVPTGVLVANDVDKTRVRAVRPVLLRSLPWSHGRRVLARSQTALVAV
jgi:hypothetical protein